MTDLPIQAPRPPLPDLLMTIFLRLVALGTLWFALMIWADLIGYHHGGAGRFDLLDADMKAARGTLAVLYPVAAVGLWLRGAWGPVIWGVAAIMEIGLQQAMPGTFEIDPLKVALVSLIALIYLLLRLWTLLTKPPVNEAR
ncbi:DUF6163 family protein [Rhizobium sp. G21]|uniref:DUF6163 family protein n=2 Tax=unclassified Rhizobium TaxID=2613769 RepID=UPI0015FF8EEE|nr:DUF6163 family protein [Rhizobium sp. G21]MBB1248062.1 hypothetical protein [Rhizobium sp. G21]